MLLPFFALVKLKSCNFYNAYHINVVFGVSQTQTLKKHIYDMVPCFVCSKLLDLTHELIIKPSEVLNFAVQSYTSGMSN